MNHPKVTIGVVLFGTKYLKESLPSLLASEYPNLSIILRDQEEGTWSAFELIQKELPEVAADPRVQLMKGENIWHSGGQNVCIRKAKENGSAYYLAGSNDMLYAPDCISNMVAALEKHADYGFAAPKLLRWEYEKKEKTDFFDSAGLQLFASQQVVDRGQGEKDSGQFVGGRVFGASGALVAFRMSALESVAFDDQYFDELVHYKNDVELSYRLNWAGQTCVYIPEAVAWHDRQLADRGIRGRIQTPRWAKESSFFGQLVLLARHFSADFSARVKLATAVDVLKRILFALVLEPYQFRQVLRFLRSRAEIAHRKAAVPRQATAAEIESLMS